MKANKKKAKSNLNTYIAVGIFGGIMAIVLGVLVFNPEIPLHQTPALDPSFIQSQNALNLGYSLKENTYFKDWNLKDVTQASQTYISQQAKTMSPCQTYLNEGGLVPESYDIREEFPHCMTEIYNQGNCSSSYALSVASTLSERYCIQSQGKMLITLSGQDLVSCDKKNNGCQQGHIDSVWTYIRDVGLVESKVLPYTSKDLKAPDCPERAEENTFKVSEFCATATEAAIMREIKKNGPVVGIMPLHTDFLSYGSGVYRPNIAATKLKAAHAVEMVGWGTDDKQQAYWIVKNSWGSDWGENGYAKVVRNAKDLGIEDFVVTGTPFVPEQLRAQAPAPVVEVEDIEDLNTQKKPVETPKVEKPAEKAPEPVKEAPKVEEKKPEPVKEAPKVEEKKPEPVKEAPKVEEKKPEPVKEAPKVEEKKPEPVKEAPKVEEKKPEPVKEAPKVEEKKPEPVKEAPKVEEKKPEPVKEEPKVEEKKPEPAKEEPKVEEKKPEPVKTEEPKVEEKKPEPVKTEEPAKTEEKKVEEPPKTEEKKPERPKRREPKKAETN